VTRTTSKTVESPKEEPIFVWICLGILWRRANNGDLIRGENSLTKCIFAISLSQRAAFFNGEADKKPKGVAAKYRHILIAFAPNPVFVITQHNDAWFGTEREQIFILLDG
jgi:hypothetical protein